MVHSCRLFSYNRMFWMSRMFIAYTQMILIINTFPLCLNFPHSASLYLFKFIFYCKVQSGETRSAGYFRALIDFTVQNGLHFLCVPTQIQKPNYKAFALHREFPIIILRKVVNKRYHLVKQKYSHIRIKLNYNIRHTLNSFSIFAKQASSLLSSKAASTGSSLDRER